MTELTRKKYLSDIQPLRDNRTPWDPECYLGDFDSTVQVNAPDLDAVCQPFDQDDQRRRKYNGKVAWRFRGMNGD